MRVSVIVAAFNAAETHHETVASLRGQTSSDWEAVIVDDGSTDATAAIAASAAADDSRIRLLSEPHRGASAARNAGIRAARGDWLLFLDADDWLAPEHLELMTGVLASDPRLDAVHCGWARVAPPGTRVGQEFAPALADLFPILACYCPFAIHACIVRRTLVEAAGGFDSRLETCEEWDMWQRVARCGARFGTVPEVLAFYRSRPGSASTNIARCLVDG